MMRLNEQLPSDFARFSENREITISPQASLFLSATRTFFSLAGLLFRRPEIGRQTKITKPREVAVNTNAIDTTESE